MDLTFSEIDNNDGGYPNESYANINSDRYWEAPPTPVQPAAKTEKKRVSFDDIMRNMNLVVSKTGVLQSIKQQPQKQQQYPPQQYPQPNKEVQVQKQGPVDPSVKHSYIYNKYFKDYQDAAPAEPEIKVPKTKEEYFRMVAEERRRQIEEKIRISQIKSTKLMFTTNAGPQGTVQASRNTLRKLSFR